MAFSTTTTNPACRIQTLVKPYPQSPLFPNLPLNPHKFTLLPSKPSSISCVLTTKPQVMGQEENSGSGLGVLQRPDSFGRFGKFGGKYVPETLMHALTELEAAFKALASDQDFQKELDGILKDYVGRESPLYFAERLTEHYKRPNGEGPLIYLKREDLNHTGAHKINNAVAQALLAKRLGKKRIIAETGAGQHGVATATVCARFGLQCIIYMGAQDMERQSLNVFRMRLLGAEVRAVHAGTATLKDATSEAIRDWVTNVETTHYILGSVAGPHPYPMMVREFHAVIGKETRKQALEKWGGKPDVLVACVGGGSNAMGLFHEFVEDEDVRLIGVEAAGFGLDSGKHAATLTKGEVGVLHGAMSYLLQDNDGQITEPHSISAGLDYPGVGPEHSFLKDMGRAVEFYHNHHLLYSKMIHFVLLISRQGKVRLTKWYSPYSQKERTKVIRELSSMILTRAPKLCNFVEWRGFKVVYKRYASLYFCMCINQDDNELEVLEIIHHYVEILDRYFGSVCELDLIFNFHKAYFILDEILIAGELQESSKKTVARLVAAQDSLVEAAKEQANSVSYIISQATK